MGFLKHVFFMMKILFPIFYLQKKNPHTFLLMYFLFHDMNKKTSVQEAKEAYEKAFANEIEASLAAEHDMEEDKMNRSDVANSSKRSRKRKPTSNKQNLSDEGINNDSNINDIYHINSIGHENHNDRPNKKQRYAKNICSVPNILQPNDIIIQQQLAMMKVISNNNSFTTLLQVMHCVYLFFAFIQFRLALLMIVMAFIFF